jgi:hypothetical protein
MGDFLLFVGGLLALNLLSFGGLLPYAIAGLVGLRRAASGRWSVLSAVVLAALALVFAWLAMRAGLGYDHRQAGHGVEPREPGRLRAVPRPGGLHRDARGRLRGVLPVPLAGRRGLVPARIELAP